MDFIVGVAFEAVNIFPWCVAVNMYREYAAVKNLVNPRRISLVGQYARIDVISMISLIRLIDGGAAMFLAVNRNHHIDSAGSITRSPFVRYRLRVCVNS